MLFIAILAAAVIIYYIQAAVYQKKAFDRLSYSVSLSSAEVFEGEDVFLYEEISNAKALPVASVRVNTELPKGLYIRLSSKMLSSKMLSDKMPSGKIPLNKKPDKKRSRSKNEANEVLETYIQSAFVLKGNSKIKRRWRISCLTRGVYDLNSAILIANDLFGFNTESKALEAPPSRRGRITVLPAAIDLEKNFTSSYIRSGEVAVPRSLISDPLLISGSREYTVSDPMNKINWKSTAIHDTLMVNIEDHTEQYQFNILLNMQSRTIELHPHEPSSPEYIEMCVTVCASIFDKVSSGNIPVRLFANTPPESVGAEAVSKEEIGRQIMVTRRYRGKEDMLDALRLLASLKLEISCQFDKLLDYVSENPYLYAEKGNIIIVSSYIDERMTVFHDILKKRGVRVIFYITTANQNADISDGDIEIYYRTYR